MDLTKGGQDIALSDLAVGDQVRFRQTRNDDGTYAVNALAVVLPSARSTVSDVSASKFKPFDRRGCRRRRQRSRIPTRRRSGRVRRTGRGARQLRIPGPGRGGLRGLRGQSA